MNRWLTEDEDLVDRTPVEYIDDLLKREQENFTKRCLSKVGLTEKKGLDGQLMLYPIKDQDKIMEKAQLDLMVKRLYKVKERPEDVHSHSITSKKSINKSENSIWSQRSGQKSNKTRITDQSRVSKAS